MGNPYTVCCFFSCVILKIGYIFVSLVLAMESQAEALGQLSSDDLDGKVTLSLVSYHSCGFTFEFHT